MGCDKNWLVKMLQAELETGSLDGKFEAHGMAVRLAAKLMSECDISPRVPMSMPTNLLDMARQGYKMDKK